MRNDYKMCTPFFPPVLRSGLIFFLQLPRCCDLNTYVKLSTENYLWWRWMKIESLYATWWISIFFLFLVNVMPLQLNSAKKKTWIFWALGFQHLRWENPIYGWKSGTFLVSSYKWLGWCAQCVTIKMCDSKLMELE